MDEMDRRLRTMAHAERPPLPREYEDAIDGLEARIRAAGR